MHTAPKIILSFAVAAFFAATVFFGGVIDQRESYVAQASFFDFIRAFVTINPLAVEVSAPSEVEIGKVFKVDALVINKGEVRIEGVEGEIFLPEELSLVGKNTVKGAGAISGGRDKKITWSVRGDAIGSYVITVSVSGEVQGNIVSAEGSKLVIVKENNPPPDRLSSAFQNVFNFVRGWLLR